MDGRIVMQLLADVLYIKGILCFEEYESIMGISDANDVESFVDKMLRGDFNVYKRGEVYTASVSGGGGE